MGYRETDIKLPTDFDDQLLGQKIKKEFRISRFRYEIISMSLDARNKKFIHWQVRIGIFSDELKGGMPAARAGDMATCVGPPDAIAKGSATVMIGKMPAARLGDLTAHGGSVVMGCPTVMIGG